MLFEPLWKHATSGDTVQGFHNCSLVLCPLLPSGNSQYSQQQTGYQQGSAQQQTYSQQQYPNQQSYPGQQQGYGKRTAYIMMLSFRQMLSKLILAEMLVSG